MKKKILFATISSIVATLSIQTNADYVIKIPLDKQAIVLNESAIDGDLFLSNSSINRGESSVINWNYEYSNEVEIKGLGFYAKSGSLTVNPLESTNYEIEITRGSNKKTQNLFLNVVQPTQNISFIADKYKVSSGQPVNLQWNVQNSETISIDNGIGIQSSLSGGLNVYPNVDTTYKLTAKGYTGISDLSESVFIDIIDDAAITAFTAPVESFINTDFNLSWTGNDVDKYELKSNNSNSIISTTGINLNKDLSYAINENTIGNYTYTLSGYNEINQKTELNKTVQIIPEPTLTNILVNGQTNPTVSSGSAISFSGIGMGSGDILEGRDATNTTTVSLPTVAPANGNHTYYGRSKKIVNGVAKYSDLVSTSLTVGNYFSADISGNNGVFFYFNKFYGVGAYSNSLNNYGKVLNINGSNYLHYDMLAENSNKCTSFRLFYTNGKEVNGPNGAPDNWLDGFSKVSLVTTEDILYTFVLSSIPQYYNYKAKVSACDDILFQKWYANPALVKEIRLHN